jgi:hypothetical protein
VVNALGNSLGDVCGWGDVLEREHREDEIRLCVRAKEGNIEIQRRRPE